MAGRPHPRPVGRTAPSTRRPRRTALEPAGPQRRTSSSCPRTRVPASPAVDRRLASPAIGPSCPLGRCGSLDLLQALDRADPDPDLVQVRRRAEAHPHGAPGPRHRLAEDLLLHAVLPQDPGGHRGRRVGLRDQVVEQLLRGQGARLPQRRAGSVGHAAIVSNVCSILVGARARRCLRGHSPGCSFLRSGVRALSRRTAALRPRCFGGGAATSLRRPSGAARGRSRGRRGPGVHFHRGKQVRHACQSTTSRRPGGCGHGCGGDDRGGGRRANGRGGDRHHRRGRLRVGSTDPCRGVHQRHGAEPDELVRLQQSRPQRTGPASTPGLVGLGRQRDRPRRRQRHHGRHGGEVVAGPTRRTAGGRCA